MFHFGRNRCSTSSEIRSFGSFRLRRREPHRGRNPRTGDRVDVPSKRFAYFTPGKELKALINREPSTDTTAGPQAALEGR